MTLATFFNGPKKLLYVLNERLLPAQKVKFTKNTWHVKCSPRSQLWFSFHQKFESKAMKGRKMAKTKLKKKSATSTSLPSFEKTVFFHTQEQLWYFFRYIHQKGEIKSFLIDCSVLYTSWIGKTKNQFELNKVWIT